MAVERSQGACNEVKPTTHNVTLHRNSFNTVRYA